MFRPSSHREGGASWVLTISFTRPITARPHDGGRVTDYLAVRARRTTVYRVLPAGGVHLNRPQHTITRPVPEYALQKRPASAPATD